METTYINTKINFIAENEVIPFGDIPQTGDFLIIFALLAIAIAGVLCFFGFRIYNTRRVASNGNCAAKPNNMVRYIKLMLIVIPIIFAFIYGPIALVGHANAETNTIKYSDNITATVSSDGRIVVEDNYINNLSSFNYRMAFSSVSVTNEAAAKGDLNNAYIAVKSNSFKGEIFNGNPEENQPINDVQNLTIGKDADMKFTIDMDPELAKSLVGTSVFNFQIKLNDENVTPLL